jgi:hypothetical protein
LVLAGVAAGCLSLTAPTSANNLDHTTAVKAAREVARRDCRATSGCTDYFVRRLHKVSRHKVVGKIATLSVTDGREILCTRHIELNLSHTSGVITYAVSGQRCHDVGPA